MDAESVAFCQVSDQRACYAFLLMETNAHMALKRLAVRHLREIGCVAVATEVQCPIARFRVDVAGYRDRRDDCRTPQTIVIECKQSRQDFLRDREQIEPLLELREQLERIRQSIEEHRIKRLEPALRNAGSSLFAELDDWRFRESKLPGYRTVLRQLRRIDDKLHGETKFFLMAKYALADELYLFTPCGLIRPRELPAGWGLLECAEDALMRTHEERAEVVDDVLPIRQCVDSARFNHKPTHRMRMLRNIAVAASRHVP